jgi:hypothetical protein
MCAGNSHELLPKECVQFGVRYPVELTLAGHEFAYDGRRPAKGVAQGVIRIGRLDDAGFGQGSLCYVHEKTDWDTTATRLQVRRFGRYIGDAERSDAGHSSDRWDD